MKIFSSINLAIVILVVAMGVGTYIENRNDTMHEYALDISVNLERMLRLNQALSSMLLLAVREQNIIRTASYDTVNKHLQSTLQTLVKLTKAQNLSGDIDTLRLDRNKLQRVEEEAMQLMRQEQWGKAADILFAESNVLAKKLYEINSDTAVGVLTGELADHERFFDHARIASLWLRVVSLLLLLWIGIRYSRRIKSEMDTQVHLRAEISLAKKELEIKVAQRTFELEAANLKLGVLSHTDSLTGLWNRRKFDLVLDSEWQRATRHGTPLALAMIDIDQFKTFNDQYGHQAGDDCLKRIASALKAGINRSGELVARYGGEEFVVILPSLTSEKAFDVIERIRRLVVDLNIPHTGSSNMSIVTISAGVVSRLPSQGGSFRELIREADRRLYLAKEQGRNQVIAVT